MPKVRWVVSYRFCSKFHTLSSGAKILKICQDLTSYTQSEGGNFLKAECILCLKKRPNFDLLFTHTVWLQQFLAKMLPRK